MTPGDDYLHIVQTRFNLATPGKESDIRNQPGWLRRRFELFEAHCLPSLAAQTERRFHWVIYFDDQTPAEFRERIEALRRIQPFTPYYTANFPAEGWPRSLRETFPDRPEWILTTRVDNDDGLAVDYVARAQEALRDGPAARGALNFRNGLILRAGRVYAHAHPCNAFFSWFERDDADMRTALSIQHMHLAEAGPIRQIDGPPAWLQVVHEVNVSNKVRGRRVDPAVARGLFAETALGPLETPSAAARAFENLALAPLRAARDAAFAARRAMLRQGAAMIGRR
jgi:hypothetical protein